MLLIFKYVCYSFFTRYDIDSKVDTLRNKTNFEVFNILLKHLNFYEDADLKTNNKVEQTTAT